MLQPGDIFYTRSGSGVGRVIRHGSASHWSHCGVIHAPLGHGLYLTAEAYGDGLRFRHRRITLGGPGDSTRFLVMRPCRDEAEVGELLATSEELVLRCRGYDWAEIGRIALRTLGIKVGPRDNDPTKWICSGHTATAVVAARPDLAERLPVPPHAIWPGALREALGGKVPEVRDLIENDAVALVS